MHLLAAAEGLSSLTTLSLLFLVLAVGLALAFEFVNGFHDTANAVATVIYTHTLPPWVAVVWSGLCNLAGVLVSSGAVAYSILALLPVELVLNVGSGAGFAMIFALLMSAIVWNLGTWYLGLPASSSHTLIGSILGVGLANALMSGHTLVEGVNWAQVDKVFLSLLVSPIVGFGCAGLLLLLLKVLIRKPALFQPPEGKQPPPAWIRGILMLTCTGVSFAHGSNDGQKGMGLLLLILIGILPAEYALNLGAKAEELRKLETTSAMVQPMLDARATAAAADPVAQAQAAAEKPAAAGKVEAAMTNGLLSSGDPAQTGGAVADNAAELSQYLSTDGKLSARTFTAVASANRDLLGLISGKSTLRDVPAADRKRLRTDLYLVDQTLAKMGKANQLSGDKNMLADYHKELDGTTKYLPLWVKVAVAMALGCGTMIGWKRIVTTVGEKIGKEHLNYGQGMSAELVAMLTIGAADFFGMPVSTTHVLSSGVAGTMAANRSGLQASTMRNIIMAWVLTLPVCVLLGAGLFAAGLMVVLSHLAAVITGAIVLAALGTAVWRVVLLARRREENRQQPSAAVPSM
jgi:PiT family inorganic phosphate transporter